MFDVETVFDVLVEASFVRLHESARGSETCGVEERVGIGDTEAIRSDVIHHQSIVKRSEGNEGRGTFGADHVENGVTDVDNPSVDNTVVADGSEVDRFFVPILALRFALVDVTTKGVHKERQESVETACGDVPVPVSRLSILREEDVYEHTTREDCTGRASDIEEPIDISYSVCKNSTPDTPDGLGSDLVARGGETSVTEETQHGPRFHDSDLLGVVQSRSE